MNKIHTQIGDIIINNNNELTTGVAKVVKINFLKAGIVGGYKDDNNEDYSIYIPAEKMINNMVSCWDGIAIINTHEGDSVISNLTKAYIEEINGEKWVCGEFAIQDTNIINALQNGYSVSCAYKPKLANISNKTHNGIVCKYDVDEIEPIHIAIVESPRYEEANAIILNSIKPTKPILKQFNSNNMSSLRDMIGLGKKPNLNSTEPEIEKPTEKKEGSAMNGFKAYYKKNEATEEDVTPVKEATEEDVTPVKTNEDENQEGLEVIPMEDLMEKSITTAEGEVIPVVELMDFLVKYEEEEASKAVEGEKAENSMSPEEAEKISLSKNGTEFYNLHNVMQKYLDCRNVKANEEEPKAGKKEEDKEEPKEEGKTISNSKPVQKVFTLSNTIAKAETTGSFQNSLMNAKLGENVADVKRQPFFSTNDVKNILFPTKK